MSGSYYTLDAKYNTFSSQLDQIPPQIQELQADLVITEGKIPPTQLTQWKYSVSTNATGTGVVPLNIGVAMFSGGYTASYTKFRSMETGTGQGTAQMDANGVWTALKEGTYRIEVNISDYVSGTSVYPNAYYININDTAGFWGTGVLMKGGTTAQYNSSSSPVARVTHYSADVFLNEGDTFTITGGGTTGYFYSAYRYTFVAITKLTGYGQ